MHFMFWNLDFGVFEKFWDFLKLMSFCWILGLGFEDLILKTSCIASHLHYNSIIMHRCVQSICVLVGLDWAKPMISLLCMSHAHAFPMHTYSNFIIFIYCETVWSFFDCLSLSLPLLLVTLVVSMAPKRKSTPSRNPFHSRASSSSDPTPISVRFHDDNAYKAFSENFSWWGIHSERQVILADFADIDLPDVIHI